jgi:hypothetical protein
MNLLHDLPYQSHRLAFGLCHIADSAEPYRVLQHLGGIPNEPSRAERLCIGDVFGTHPIDEKRPISTYVPTRRTADGPYGPVRERGEFQEPSELGAMDLHCPHPVFQRILVDEEPHEGGRCPIQRPFLSFDPAIDYPVGVESPGLGQPARAYSSVWASTGTQPSDQMKI